MTHWTKKQTARLKAALKNGECVAFCNTDAHGGPANGGSTAHGRAKVGLIQTIESAFEPCSENALHATLEPHRWAGSRVWIVVMSGIVQHVDETKIAATRREFIGEILPEECIFSASIGVRLGLKNLGGANLCGANLGGANLYGANLGGANLCGANLRGADLCGANLRGANLCGADLRGADLRGADLYEANLRAARTEITITK